MQRKSFALKALHFNDSPLYLEIGKMSLESGTFQDSAADDFNILPSSVRFSLILKDFKNQFQKYFKNKVTVIFHVIENSLQLHLKILENVFHVLLYIFVMLCYR